MKYLTALLFALAACGDGSPSGKDAPLQPKASDAAPDRSEPEPESENQGPCQDREAGPAVEPIDFAELDLPSGWWSIYGARRGTGFHHYRPSRCPDEPVFIHNYDVSIYIVPEAQWFTRGEGAHLKFTTFNVEDEEVSVDARRIETGMFCGTVRYQGQESERTITWAGDHGPSGPIEDWLAGHLYERICAGEEIQLDWVRHRELLDRLYN